ncbi:hypothetical protein J1N35_019458 [Gossypium stocksii]|uniref:Uncharacterized protein n=1 Tax=Gossypium stocksii TaxID=47602 RepID=A0A9D4A897_9ROSI|nr:hypothetical protein J1N35_019458 [Gossypium stocksii]
MGVFGIGGFEASIVFGCLNREFRFSRKTMNMGPFTSYLVKIYRIFGATKTSQALLVIQVLTLTLELSKAAEMIWNPLNKRGGRVQLLEISLPLSEFDHGVKGHALHGSIEIDKDSARKRTSNGRCVAD